MVHFSEFFENLKLAVKQYSVTIQVSFNRTKIGGNAKIQVRHFE